MHEQKLRSYNVHAKVEWGRKENRWKTRERENARLHLKRDSRFLALPPPFFKKIAAVRPSVSRTTSMVVSLVGKCCH